MTALAIDFGTSNTVVCLQDPVKQQPETLDIGSLSVRYDQGPPLTPTLVYVDRGRKILIGRPASEKGDRSRLLRGFKRDLSQEFQPAPTQIDGTGYTPQLAAQHFLTQLFGQLQQQRVQPTELVFSAPVGAYEAYLRVLQDIAGQLRVDVSKVRFVDESTAAALGYGIDKPGSIVLVLDLGGGTLDISLVRILKLAGETGSHKAEVIAKSDRAYGCGGLDIDTWIAEDVLQKQGRARKDVDASTWQNLLEIAERVKIRLSQHQSAQESFVDEETFDTYDIKLERWQLEEILQERFFLDYMREAIDETLERAYAKGISKRDVEHVLLVGGTSLIPAVQQLAVSTFGRDKVQFHKPFEAVAHGALSLMRYASLDDHLRHTYALRLYNRYTQENDYYPLFESGAKYPAQTDVIPLQANSSGQREIELVIGELGAKGATEVYYDADGRMQTRSSSQESSFRPFGKGAVSFKLDPPGEAGKDRLEVTFKIDAGRNLRVNVLDLLTRQTVVGDLVVGRLV